MSRMLAGMIAALSAASVGCYSAPVMPPSGLVYSKVEAPVSPAVMGREVGALKGEASAKSLFGLVAWGDASVEAAIRDGGITSPRHIDYKFFNVALVYQEFTTIVYGE